MADVVCTDRAADLVRADDAHHLAAQYRNAVTAGYLSDQYREAVRQCEILLREMNAACLALFRYREANSEAEMQPKRPGATG